MNGKKHGKGVEFDEYHSTRFIGNYLNGKKNGKGIEYSNYYYNLKAGGAYYNRLKYLIFKGEYMNNCRVRNKECYKNCKLEYEGEYLFNDK